MNQLQIFKNEKFGQMRMMTIDGEPWFVGKDVAEALGYSNTKDAVITHVSEEDKRIIQRSEIATIENHLPKDVFPVNFVRADIPNRGLTFINESGLYALIFGSKLESAREFKHWVTSEVLPSIRKTGGYQKPLSPVDMMRIQLGMIDEHEQRIEKLEHTMNIDYGQQQALKKQVNASVIRALGGSGSKAYQEMSKKVFSECNRDIQDYFGVNSRNNIPRLRFEEAMDYVKCWEPCNNTKLEIRNSNFQIGIVS